MATEKHFDRGVRITSSLLIPLEEIEWRFSGSGGPGGQHANTANTRVELLFNVRDAKSLGPRQRARLIERLGEHVRVVASDERSQLRNRQLALERFAERLARALHVEPTRRATTPTLGSKKRRLEDKRQLSERKRLRRSPAED